MKKENKNLSRVLQKEAEILNELDFDALIRCYYVFNDLDNYYYVMEFGGGGDFDTLLKKCVNTLPEPIVKLFLAEMILGLEYLHSKKIYHKDIKPQNILISNNVH